jgi:hypothetical protein
MNNEQHTSYSEEKNGRRGGYRLDIWSEESLNAEHYFQATTEANKNWC